jgi:hypothetical protein
MAGVGRRDWEREIDEVLRGAKPGLGGSSCGSQGDRGLRTRLGEREVVGAAALKRASKSSLSCWEAEKQRMTMKRHQ